MTSSSVAATTTPSSVQNSNSSPWLPGVAGVRRSTTVNTSSVDLDTSSSSCCSSSVSSWIALAASTAAASTATAAAELVEMMNWRCVANLVLISHLLRTVWVMVCVRDCVWVCFVVGYWVDIYRSFVYLILLKASLHALSMRNSLTLFSLYLLFLLSLFRLYFFHSFSLSLPSLFISSSVLRQLWCLKLVWAA